MGLPMKSISLNGTWSLTYGPQTAKAPLTPPELRKSRWPKIKASVPGNVELDLMVAGKLEKHPERGSRVYGLIELEKNDWWYQRSFPAPVFKSGQRVELVFEGLDCIGTVWINGKLAGTADNMLIQHRFDVTSLLNRKGQNNLAVRIASAVLEGRRIQNEPLEMVATSTFEYANLRKAPHMFGWDIMPRIVSAGLWREVRLDVIEPTRFRSVYWATIDADSEAKTARIFLDWDFATGESDLSGWKVTAVISRHGEIDRKHVFPVFATHGQVQINLNDISLWWPRGYGEPVLYDGNLSLTDTLGRVRAEHRCKIGFRTIRLERTDITTPEKPGEFVFRVNGEKVFIKGTNWVPLDAMHSRDSERLETVFAMIVDLNCNMVRCWGGNVYEDHSFFDLCDENGVMVWQDFAMACAVYPQTENFASRIRREAEMVTSKLRNHTSLALWAGNNEIDSFMVWSYGKRLDPNRDILSRQVLPEVIRRLDPWRDYLPSSPYFSTALMQSENHEYFQPEQHNWSRGDFKGKTYVESLAHFASEIGWHGCPHRDTLEAMLDGDHLWPWQDNDQWLTHAVRHLPAFTTFNYRIQLMADQIELLFGKTPDDLDSFVMASQISQAEGIKFLIEWFRAGKWRRTGLLWWNLRDGWPIFSDAVVDYYNRKKLAYAYIKRAQEDVCAICAEPENGRHEVIVVNDTRMSVSGHLSMVDADSGRKLLEKAFAVPSNGKVAVGHVSAAKRPAMWLIRWNVGSRERCSHYLAGPRPFDLGQYRKWLEKHGLAGE